VSSRIQTLIGIWIKKSNLSSISKGFNADNQFVLEPGKVISSNDKPEFIEPKEKIGETFDPLTRLITRCVCIGQNLSYQTVTKDLQGMNFASSRANLIGDRAQFSVIQDHLVHDSFRLDWNTYVFWMFVTGNMAPLTLTTYKQDPWKWQQCYWQRPGWDWVDPLRDAEAAIELRKNNLLTLEEYWGNKGLGWKTQMRQIAKEKAAVKALEEEFEVSLGENDQVAAESVEAMRALRGRDRQTDGSDD